MWRCDPALYSRPQLWLNPDVVAAPLHRPRTTAPASVAERARAAVRHIHEHTKRQQDAGAAVAAEDGPGSADGAPERPFFCMQSLRDYKLVRAAAAAVSTMPVLCGLGGLVAVMVL